MSNDVIVNKARALDEFAGWTDAAESDREQVSERSIIGQRLRFSNEGYWLLPDQSVLDKLLMAANTRRAVVKWHPNKNAAPETIFLQAGEKFPDLKTRNAETPKSEWIEGFNGEMKGPWEAQHVVYLVDPTNFDQYSYPTATIGGSIAVRELVERINWMRRFRGCAVYPIVKPTTQFMQTKYAGRLRPHFEIIEWTQFNLDAIPANEPQQQLTDQAEKMQAVLRTMGAQPVEMPTAKEVTGDEVIF